MFTSALPLALWNQFGWYTVIVAPVVSFLIMGIENVGNQIENPLLVLPMGAYCSKLHHDIVGITERWVSGDPEVRLCFQNRCKTCSRDTLIPRICIFFICYLAPKFISCIIKHDIHICMLPGEVTNKPAATRPLR